MVKNIGDKHHVFPKKYLEDHGYDQDYYNKIANYVIINKETNIAIGKKSPKEYLQEIPEDELNYAEHALPETLATMTVDDYENFLDQRRKLMTDKIRKYYEHFK